jgi:hypothetical protein
VDALVVVELVLLVLVVLVVVVVRTHLAVLLELQVKEILVAVEINPVLIIHLAVAEVLEL